MMQGQSPVQTLRSLKRQHSVRQWSPFANDKRQTTTKAINDKYLNFAFHVLDIDECLTAANNCRYACKNLIGSFMCICPEGYVQIGTGDQCRGR